MNQTCELIDEAIDRYNCGKVVVALSGGDDSMAVLTQAREHDAFAGALHLNTGTGVEATREHVHETCLSIGCPLAEVCSKDNCDAHGNPDPQVYEQIVMEHGFPGPTKFGHGKMYARLKERGLRLFARQNGLNSRRPLGIITGARSEESTRRMGFVKPIAQGVQTRGGVREKHFVWIAGIHDWTKRQTLAAIANSGIERNPVSRCIHRSGECNCGGMATGLEELEEMTCYPITRPRALWLLDLDRRVYSKHGWHWWERKPQWAIDRDRGHGLLFDMHEQLPMCHSCEANSSSGGLRTR